MVISLFRKSRKHPKTMHCWILNMLCSWENKITSSRISTTTGSSPAVTIAFREDFWSTRDQSTYFASGRSDFKVNKHNKRLIPVAIGTIMLSLTCLRVTFSAWWANSLEMVSRVLDPLAFGWLSQRLPDLPMPWARLYHLSDTSLSRC